MGKRTEQSIPDEIREVYEPCCDSGATIMYRGLTLEKLAWPDRAHSQWRITQDGEYIETINVAAFRSAGELRRWLDVVADGEIPEVALRGGSVRSAPGD